VIIAKDGTLMGVPRDAGLKLKVFPKVHVSPSDFSLKPQKRGYVKVRVMDQVTELVTKEAILDLPTHNGELTAHPEQDISKASVISWAGKMFTGLIRGQGFHGGAMATSGAWETFGTVVVGANDEDMAAAVNHVSGLGGGIAVCAQGEVLAELPLPIAGSMSNLKLEEIVRRLDTIQEKARALGFRFPDACLTLATLTTPAIPFLRLSEDGLVDVKKGQVVELFTS
jgi:adenine deaminase